MRKCRQSLMMLIGLGVLVNALVAQPVQVTGKNLRIEFNKVLNSRIVAFFNGREIPLGDYSPSESIIVAGHPIDGIHPERTKPGGFSGWDRQGSALDTPQVRPRL